jgi:plasmid stability protein
MAQVLIRQLDEQVVERLRVRARQRGLSLEQSIRELLTAAASSGLDLREDLARLRAQTPPAGRSLDVAALIRSERDAR